LTGISGRTKRDEENKYRKDQRNYERGEGNEDERKEN
jgi:hypothetical protein